jgi:hypothetical protein
MRPQYEYKDRTDAYQAYKILRGINGGILVLISQASAVFPQAENQLSTEEDPLSLPNIFSAFTNLPFETPNTPIYAFPVMDNKADTLTQSQMLKATDAQHFISAQPKEIKGLMDMGFSDCIIFSHKDQIIDALIRNLSQTFLLEDQGSVHDYLGIRIVKDPANKSISMTQQGLI